MRCFSSIFITQILKYHEFDMLLETNRNNRWST